MKRQQFLYFHPKIREFGDLAESPQSGVKVACPASREMRGLEMYYVYILYSESKDRYYIGHTNYLQRRLIEHNQGLTRSTKAHRPWKVVYTEKYNTRVEAYKREQEIKDYKSGYKFQLLKQSESWQSG